MKTYQSMLSKAFIWICMFVNLSLTSVWPAEPTLARVVFWLGPERMDSFEAAYQERLAPILVRHGLKPSSERSRATVDSVFARLFEVARPADVLKIREALNADTSWANALADLERDFGLHRKDLQKPLYEYVLMAYSSPTGSGTQLNVGPGRVVKANKGSGFWRTIEMAGKLSGTWVEPIFQDRDGYMGLEPTEGSRGMTGRCGHRLRQRMDWLIIG